MATLTLDNKALLLQRVRHVRGSAEMKFGLYHITYAGVGTKWVPSEHHLTAADQLGIPAQLAAVERAYAKEFTPDEDENQWWTRRFLTALPVGRDLRPVWREFALYVLTDRRYGLLSFAQHPDQVGVINKIADLFRNDNTYIGLWSEAAREAYLAYSRYSQGNARLDAPEAMEQVGAHAMYSAMHFANAWDKPSDAGEAVQWAGWCARYVRYSQHMRSAPKEQAQTDPRGYVNVGAALMDFGRWNAHSNAGDGLGEIARRQLYKTHSTRLLQLMKRHGGSKLWWLPVWN